jgi:hypothetical protein
MKPAGKTPYEIRLDLLQLAFDILTAKHAAAAGASIASGNLGVISTSPTTEEVIAEAEKMNSFISKANQ